MKTLWAPLLEMEEFRLMSEAVAKGRTPVQASGLTDAAKGHFIWGLGDKHRFRVIIAANEIRAKEIYEDYRLYDRNVFTYPAKD